MDAVRFGRWISERRRVGGWKSQKAFVEMAQQDPFLRTYSISEDFLARLEAGRLVHPFRKGIRRRVLALSGQLCKTPRELRAYLQAAELTDLSADETDYVNHLNEQLAARRNSTILFLPPRPPRLLGRAAQVQELKQVLWTLETGICAITGMAGVGKSALAAEAVHQVASNERERSRVFPDGIATFSGTGRRGIQGLIALLQDIIAVFTPTTVAISQATDAQLISPGVTSPSSKVERTIGSPTRETNRVAANGHDSRQDMLESDLAGAIDRVRQVLAGKRVLLVLDDINAQFPLRQACEALLAQEQTGSTRGVQRSVRARQPGVKRSATFEADLPVEGQRWLPAIGNTGQASRTILITSRYIPAPALVKHRLHLEPMESHAALELFTALSGHTLSSNERNCVERICAAVGYLPLAIEAAATATTVAGIPLSLLADRVTDSPLDALLDSEGEVGSRLTQALASVDLHMQQHFALLSTLGKHVFALESAAALRSMHPDANKLEIYKVSANDQYLPENGPVLCSNKSNGHHQTSQQGIEVPSTDLANTAADLAQLVRHSLVEIVPHNSSTSFPVTSNPGHPGESRYRLHPLLYAHAMDRLEQLEPEVVLTAQRNLQSYALAYTEHYRGDVPHLEREREFLLSMLAHMWNQRQYPVLVHFLRRIVSLTGRLSSYEQAERLLNWGIHASEYTQDQYHLALFLGYLGKLYTYYGRLALARATSEQSIAIAESLPHHPDSWLWGAFADLAHIAHVLGDLGAARKYTETFVKRVFETNNPLNSAFALYFRGFYTRLEGDLDRAYNDISLSHSLLSTCKTNSPFHERPFGLSILTELARVQGDYERSREYIESQIPMALTTDPLYITADMLYDQAYFALQQHMYDDARTLALRIIDMANQIGTPHLHSRALTLLQQLYTITSPHHLTR